MRIAVATVIVSLTALVLPTAQALARNSDASHGSEPSIKAPCSSYTQNADGTWTPIPCEEAGSKSQARPKPADSSDEAR
jgi:hypothetical protein